MALPTPPTRCIYPRRFSPSPCAHFFLQHWTSKREISLQREVFASQHGPEQCKRQLLFWAALCKATSISLNLLLPDVPLIPASLPSFMLGTGTCPSSKGSSPHVYGLGQSPGSEELPPPGDTAGTRGRGDGGARGRPGHDAFVMFPSPEVEPQDHEPCLCPTKRAPAPSSIDGPTLHKGRFGFGRISKFPQGLLGRGGDALQLPGGGEPSTGPKAQPRALVLGGPRPSTAFQEHSLAPRPRH